MSSLFPRFHGEFTPLFRLLDDYASHSASRSGSDSGPGGFSSALASSMRSFTPAFDVKETKEAYELHGELPGIEQKNINIEFTDASTVRISGRTEHRSTRGHPPSGFIEGGSQQGQQQGQIEGTSSESKSKDETHAYHKPTVEEGDKPSENDTAVAKADKSAAAESGHKYWVTERSIGEFSRTFAFPTHVDQDKVKASLKNGILSVVVPKATARQTRKITIE